MFLCKGFYATLNRSCKDLFKVAFPLEEKKIIITKIIIITIIIIIVNLLQLKYRNFLKWRAFQWQKYQSFEIRTKKGFFKKINSTHFNLILNFDKLFQKLSFIHILKKIWIFKIR